MSERLTLRAGYAFSGSPIEPDNAAFNVASPLTPEHAFSVGGSLWLSDSLQAHLTYLHFFENTVQGPIQTPFGPLPDSFVRHTSSIDVLSSGFTVHY